MLKEWNLPPKTSKLRCYMLVALVIIIYVLDNPYIQSRFGSQLFNYVIKPAEWIGITLIVLNFPVVRPKGKLRMHGFLSGWALVFAVIYIVASVLAGIFIDGLGKSPFSHSFTGLLSNALLIGTSIVGREFARSYIVNTVTKEENYLIFSLISFFVAILSITWSQFLKLNAFEGVVIFAANSFAPEFAKNLLATYLSYLGGPLPAIIYFGIIDGFHWCSPLLPNLRWITMALVGILVPIFSLTFFQSMYVKEAKLLKKNDSVEIWPSSGVI